MVITDAAHAADPRPHDRALDPACRGTPVQRPASGDRVTRGPRVRVPRGREHTATIVTLDGLPEQFNVSETCDLTLTVRNDGIPGGAEAPNMGGFRILVENGDLPVPVDDSLAQVLADGLTHTASGATMRSWDLQWTAPADATAPSSPSMGTP